MSSFSHRKKQVVTAVKLTDRGYWVSKAFTWVSLVYWTAYALYFRTLTYFSAANPKIHLGGMLDERKSDIYHHVPDRFLPHMKLYHTGICDHVDDICRLFTFPIILKPDVGFRGYKVKRIDSCEELRAVAPEYMNKEVLIQEFLDHPHEYAVLYYYIDEHRYGISSLIEKHLPKVYGDGIHTLRQLISLSNNSHLQQRWVLKKNKKRLDNIIPRNECIVIDHVGNYARGSKFENLNQHIDQQLVETVHRFYKNIGGMHFCRMDVKAASIDELKKGNFKLLEINGAKSEPLHIYDPRMNMSGVLSTIHQHWHILFQVVKENINTASYPSSVEGIKSYFSLKKLVSE